MFFSPPVALSHSPTPTARRQNCRGSQGWAFVMGTAARFEAHIARKLAHIICGGDATRPSTAPEQYFLDLEREAFKSLCGEPKTLARMEHLLKKGKVLRN